MNFQNEQLIDNSTAQDSATSLNTNSSPLGTGKKTVFSSLYWRLSSVLMLLLLIISIIHCALGIFFFRRVGFAAEQELSSGIAVELVRELEPLLKNEFNYWQIQEITRRYTVANPKLEIYIVDNTGIIIGDFGLNSPARLTHIAVDPIKQFLTAPVSKYPIYGDDPRNNKQTVFTAAEINLGKNNGYVYITLRSDKTERLVNLLANDALVQSGIFSIFASSFTVGLIGFAMFYLITRRFHRLTEVVRKFQYGQITERIQVERFDEVGQLALTFNEMADTIAGNINQLEKRDQLRRELIANVSHDLRGPVALIKGYIEHLSELPRNEKNWSHVAECTKIISANVGSLTQLLSELFELAKLEAREIKPNLQPFSLNQLAIDLVTTYRSKATEKNILLSYDGPESSSLALGDEIMIERVMTNLIENAIRYTPEGGRIIVRVFSENKKVRVEVIDTGVGIPAKDLPLVFQRFYRAPTTISKSNGSSGLGLAIVKRIIDLHSANITVSSVEKEGSIFAFELTTA